MKVGEYIRQWQLIQLHTTPSQLKTMIAALYCAIEWDLSLIDAQTGDKEQVRKLRKEIASFKALHKVICRVLVEE
jgi:hypothetical protein